jgi:hypothetical protein
MRKPSYFVLITADADRNRLYLPSAFDLAKYRLERKEWGLKDRTRYRKYMTPGDQVLIYISGYRENAQHFVASATIASAPTNNTGGIVDSPVMQTSIFSEYKVALKNAHYFSTPICARDLLDKFKFVAPNRRTMWRIYFQGGAIRLQAYDFNLVTRLGK